VNKAIVNEFGGKKKLRAEKMIYKNANEPLQSFETQRSTSSVYTELNHAYYDDAYASVFYWFYVSILKKWVRKGGWNYINVP